MTLSRKTPPYPATAPPQSSKVDKLKQPPPTLLFEQEPWDQPDVLVPSCKAPLQPTTAPPQLSNVEKLKLPPSTLDHWHLLLLNSEDFHLLEASQPELTFDVRSLTTASHGQVAGLQQPRPHLLLLMPVPESLLPEKKYICFWGCLAIQTHVGWGG